MKRIAATIAAVLIWSGCGEVDRDLNPEQELIQQEKEQRIQRLDHEEEMLDRAAREAKEQTGDNPVARDVLREQQQATQEAIDQRRENVRESAERAIERAE